MKRGGWFNDWETIDQREKNAFIDSCNFVLDGPPQGS